MCVFVCATKCEDFVSFSTENYRILKQQILFDFQFFIHRRTDKMFKTCCKHFYRRTPKLVGKNVNDVTHWTYKKWTMSSKRKMFGHIHDMNEEKIVRKHVELNAIEYIISQTILKTNSCRTHERLLPGEQTNRLHSNHRCLFYVFRFCRGHSHTDNLTSRCLFLFLSCVENESEEIKENENK